MKEINLVTGSSGFLGKKIVRRLIQEGKEVVGIDIHNAPDQIKGSTFIQGDIRNIDLMKNLIKGVSVVYHTAALVPLTKAYSDFRLVNEQGSQEVAKLAKNANVEKFIHISSSAVYGKTKDSPITLHTPLNPIEPYGLSKLNAELLVKKELAGSATKLVIIRPRTILGTERGGIFDMLFRWIQTDRPVFIVGNGNFRFQFIHEQDLIDAIFLTVRKNVEGEFNVGTDSYGTLNEVFKFLVNYANSSSKIRHLPVQPTIFAFRNLERLGLSPLAPWHYKTFHLPFYFDISNLTYLGWSPKYSNNSMFANSYDAFKTWSLKKHENSLSPHSSKLDSKFLNFVQRFFQ